MQPNTVEKIVFSLVPALCLILQFVLPLGIVSILLLVVACSVWLLRSQHYSREQKTLLFSLWLVAAGGAVGFYYFFGAAVEAADNGTHTAAGNTLPWVFAALGGLAIVVNLFYGLLLRQREGAVAAS